jgi:hypothetical protein
MILWQDRAKRNFAVGNACDAFRRKFRLEEPNRDSADILPVFRATPFDQRRQCIPPRENRRKLKITPWHAAEL